MRFPEIPPGVAVFFDANTLVYHFANEPQFGAACTELVKRVEQGRLQGYTLGRGASQECGPSPDDP